MNKRDITEGIEVLRVLRKICLNPPKCHKIACNCAAVATLNVIFIMRGRVKLNKTLPNILRLSPSIAHKTSSVLNGRKISEIHNYFSVTSAASIVLQPTGQEIYHQIS